MRDRLPRRHVRTRQLPLSVPMRHERPATDAAALQRAVSAVEAATLALRRRCAHLERLRQQMTEKR